MSREYSVPKLQVHARIIVSGERPADVTLFLSERAEKHAGHERPSDLLNGSLAFIPARDEHGSVVLLGHDNLMVVSVASDDEPGDEELHLADRALLDVTAVQIQVVMQDGTTLRGEVRYLMPPSQRRLQDFLNTDQRFVSLRQDNVVHLVNKGRIVQISKA